MFGSKGPVYSWCKSDIDTTVFSLSGIGLGETNDNRLSES